MVMTLCWTMTRHLRMTDDDLLDEDDYSDVADCYQTCEDYRPVSEENWRCVNYCPHCASCLNDAA